MKTNEVYVVTVAYQESPGRRYDFLTDIPGLTRGDLVVVKAATGYGLTKVIDTKEQSNKATAWVVDRVDVDGFKAKQNKRAELQQLEQAMDNYVATHGRRSQYEALATKDPHMAAMLRQYDTLVEGE